MADFDGGVFVGLDDELFGDGEGDLTEFLDSFAEACLRGNEYYLGAGQDVLAWSPPVGDHDSSVVTVTRTFASVQEMTLCPPAWVLIQPDQTGIEINGLYRVADERTVAGQPASFYTRFLLRGIGTRSFEMEHTEVLSPDWQPFSVTVGISTDIVYPVWARLEWYGRSVDVADVGSQAAATPKNRAMVSSTVYAEGSGTEPNANSPEIRCTRITSTAGDPDTLIDHIHFYDPSSEDYMVVNPGIDSVYSIAQQRQLTYLQLAGISVRPRFEVRE